MDFSQSELRDLEDSLGIPNFVPCSVQLRKRRFPAYLRQRQAAKRPLSLRYICWLWFLLYYLVFWVYTSFYATTGVFPPYTPYPRGFELTLHDFVVTSEDIDRFHAGIPIQDRTRTDVIIPNRDELYTLDIRLDGSLLLDGEPAAYASIERALCGSSWAGSEQTRYVAVRPDIAGSYQDLIAALELLDQARDAAKCTFHTIIISLHGESPAENT